MQSNSLVDVNSLIDESPHQSQTVDVNSLIEQPQKKNSSQPSSPTSAPSTSSSNGQLELLNGQRPQEYSLNKSGFKPVINMEVPKEADAQTAATKIGLTPIQDLQKQNTSRPDNTIAVPNIGVFNRQINAFGEVTNKTITDNAPDESVVLRNEYNQKRRGILNPQVVVPQSELTPENNFGLATPSNQAASDATTINKPIKKVAGTPQNEPAPTTPEQQFKQKVDDNLTQLDKETIAKTGEYAMKVTSDPVAAGFITKAVLGDNIAISQKRQIDKGYNVPQADLYNTGQVGISSFMGALDKKYEDDPQNADYLKQKADLQNQAATLIDKFPEYKTSQLTKAVAIELGKLHPETPNNAAMAQLYLPEIKKEMGLSDEDVKNIDFDNYPSSNFITSAIAPIYKGALGLGAFGTRVIGDVVGADKDFLNSKITQMQQSPTFFDDTEVMQNTGVTVDTNKTSPTFLQDVADPNKGRYNYNFHTISNAIGNGVGQLAWFVYGSKGIGAAANKVAGIASNAAADAVSLDGLPFKLSPEATNEVGMAGLMIGQGYEDNYQKARTVISDKPEDEWKRHAFALLQGSLDYLGFRVLGNVVKGLPPTAEKEIGQVFKDAPNLAAVNKTALQSKLTDVLKGLSEAGKETAFVGGATTLSEIAKAAVVNVLGNDKAAEEENKQLPDVIASSLMGLPFNMFLPIVGAKIIAGGQSKIQNENIYNAGINPESYKGDAHKLFDMGVINQEQLNDRIQVINTAANVVKSIPSDVFDNLNHNQRVSYVNSKIKEAALKAKAANIQDDALSEFYNSQIKNEVVKRADILNGGGKEGEYPQSVAVIKPKTQEEINNQIPDVTIAPNENVPRETSGAKVILPQTITKEQGRQIVTTTDKGNATENPLPDNQEKVGSANEAANKVEQQTEKTNQDYLNDVDSQLKAQGNARFGMPKVEDATKYGLPKDTGSVMFKEGKIIVFDQLGKKIKETAGTKNDFADLYQNVGNEYFDTVNKISNRNKVEEPTEKDLVNQAKDLVNSGVVKGFTEKILKESANNNPEEFKQHLKDISEQANDPKSNRLTVDTYGKELVDIAQKINHVEVKSEPSVAPAPLTNEAKDLLDGLNSGSKPTFITKNLERIANENGIEVTGKMSADDVINALKAKQNDQNTSTPTEINKPISVNNEIKNENTAGTDKNINATANIKNGSENKPITEGGKKSKHVNEAANKIKNKYKDKAKGLFDTGDNKNADMAGDSKRKITMPDGSAETVKPVAPEIVNGFYSPIEKKVLDVKASKLSANKWKELFGKGDEPKFTGMLDFLNSKKPNDQVSKQEVIDYIKNNRIQLVEVVKGDLTKREQGIIDKRNEAQQNKDYDLVNEYDKEIERIHEKQKTKYSQYQLPGEKENYKEVLITMPRAILSFSEQKEFERLRNIPVAELTKEQYNRKEELVSKIKGETKFQSSHFDEPNILAHVRMSTRTDAEGKKVLFVDEVQSDWGQKGKKEGFAISKDVAQNKITAIADKLKKYDILTVRGASNHLHFEKYVHGVWKWLDEADADVPQKEAQELMKEAREINYNAFEKPSNTPPAPFVTDTNQWAKLGLKYALRHAVEEGADKIAWTTGEQQNERYDLSKQLSSIEWKKNKDGNTYTWTAFSKENPDKVIDTDSSATLGDIEKTLGKEIAKQIKESSKPQDEIVGDKLKLGGTGMTGFYGEPSEGKVGIIGNVAKALVKELTGKEGKIIDTKIDTGEAQKSLPNFTPNEITPSDVTWQGNSYYIKGEFFGMDNSNRSKEEKVAAIVKDYNENYIEKPKPEGAFATQHSIEITPELKAAVESGMPLLDKSKIKTDNGKQSIDQYVSRAKEVASKLFPDAKFETFDTHADFEKAGGIEGSRGTAITDNEGNKTILLNLAQMKEDGVGKTAFHEVIHPIVSEVFGRTPQELVPVWNEIATTMRDVKGMDKVWEHLIWYNEHKTPVEGITEFLTQIADGNIKVDDIPKAKQSKLFDLINKLFEKLGIKFKIDSGLDLHNFATEIKKAFDTGDVEGLKKYTGKEGEQIKNADTSSDKEALVKNMVQDAMDEGLTSLNEVRDAITSGLENNSTELKRLIEDAFNKIKETPEEPEKNNIVNVPPRTGITHAATAELRDKYGLGNYVRDESLSNAELQQKADDIIAEGYNPNDLVTQMENGVPPTPVENFILKRYVGELVAKFDKSKSDADFNDLERVMKAVETIGTLQSSAFRTRGGLVDISETLPGFLRAEKELNLNAPLTEGQKAQVVKEYNDINTAQSEYEVKIAALEAENAALKAAKAANKNKPKGSTRKTHEEYVKERQDAINGAREALRKLRTGESGLSAVPLPGVRELIAIAPYVKKALTSLVSEGADKLSDYVKELHGQFSDVLEGITEKDINNIIAGKYDEKRPTKNELAARVRDLKIEAQLVSKYEDLLNGEVPKNEKAKIKRNQDIETMRAKIKSLQKSNKEAANGEKESVPDELKRLRSLKIKLQREAKKVQEDIDNGNYEKPEKKTPLLEDSEIKKQFPNEFKEALDAKDNLIKLKNERQLRLLRQQQENMSLREKTMKGVAEVFNIPRAMETMLDYSAMLRQAVIPTIAHPSLAGKSLVEMIKAGASQKRYDRWFYDLAETPRYKLMELSRLAVTDSTSPLLSAREESFMSNLAEKIPIIGKTLNVGGVKIPGTNLVKGSERAYTMYLNKMRVDLFNRFADAMEERGLTWENSPKAYKEMANYVNNSTGRGDIGEKLDRIAPILNSLFFSPRLIASRMNMLTYFAQPRFYKSVPREVRIAYFKDMTKFIGLGITVLGLFSLNKKDDTEVETDPRSSDFGKIKDKNTRWDIWGGFQQYVRLFAQVASGERKSTTGKMYTLNGEGAFGQTTTDVLTSFGRGKLAPVPGMAVDLLSKRTMSGDKIKFQTGQEGYKEINIGRYTKEHLLPLNFTGLQDALKDQGAKAWFTVGVPSTFGVGTQTFATNSKPPKHKGSKKYSY